MNRDYVLQQLNATAQAIQIAGQNKVRGEVRSRVNDQVITTHVAATAEEAINGALKAAMLMRGVEPGPVTKDQALERKVAELTKRLDEAETRISTLENAGNSDAAVNDPPVRQSTPYDELPGAALAERLEDRGIDVPPGDKRKGEWREQAIALLVESDQQNN